MLISTVIDTSKMAHLTKDQYGAFVAHCLNQQGVRSVLVDLVKQEITISYSLTLPGCLKTDKELEETIVALGNLEPYPCNCGCGAFIAISTCYRQSESNIWATNSRLLNEEEKLLAEQKNHAIPAIKAYRDRTGAGLKDAKDAVDTYRESLPSSSPGYRNLKSLTY